MAMPSSHVPPEPGSAQVWRQLDAALRQQAIAVVAQMAFNLIKTQSAPSQQESDDDHPTQLNQAPQ
jgi:hypothetical protein